MYITFQYMHHLRSTPLLVPTKFNGFMSLQKNMVASETQPLLKATTRHQGPPSSHHFSHLPVFGGADTVCWRIGIVKMYCYL